MGAGAAKAIEENATSPRKMETPRRADTTMPENEPLLFPTPRNTKAVLIGYQSFPEAEFPEREKLREIEIFALEAFSLAAKQPALSDLLRNPHSGFDSS